MAKKAKTMVLVHPKGRYYHQILCPLADVGFRLVPYDQVSAPPERRGYFNTNEGAEWGRLLCPCPMCYPQKVEAK